MAPTWEDVISDKTKYPDDTVLKLADGSEVRLSDARPGYMKDADYRQKTTALARQRETFEAESVQRMQAIQQGEAQLMQIAQELVKQNPGLSQRQAREMVEESSDPDVRQLKAELSELKNTIKPLAEAVLDLNNRSVEARKAFVVSEHRKALAELKAADPTLNEQELVDYAKSNYVPNLRVAYKAMNHEKIVEKSVKAEREKALVEGAEKAKSELLAAPLIPLRTAGPRNETAPKNWREIMDKALNDPEIMNPLAQSRLG